MELKIGEAQMMLDVNNSHSSLHGRGGNGQKQQQLPALG